MATLNIPKRGQPVRGSKTGQPIMVLFDLLGRRWAMGIIWNLHKGPCTFRQLQTQCETISPSVLNTRLKELRATGLVAKQPTGYCLSADGEALYLHLASLGEWADDWTRR